MAELANVIDQMPAGGGVSTPASGTYGEGAATERLKATLPGMDPTQTQAQAPTPMTGGGPAPQQTAPGLPRGLMAPTRQPDVPVSTPLAGPQVLVGSPPEQRMRLLEALVADPDVSEDTKEFATILLGHYKRRGR